MNYLVSISDFRKDVKNTRQGYFTLHVDGIAIKQCVAHRHPAGKVWYAPPALLIDGRYINVVQIEDEAKQRYTQDLVSKMLTESCLD